MYDRAMEARSMAEEKSRFNAPAGIGSASMNDYASEPMSTLTTASSNRGEVATALEAQEMATMELLEALKYLRQKLQPVLSPRPEKDGRNSAEVGYGSPIANCIQQNTQRLRSAAQIVAMLTSEVAL